MNRTFCEAMNSGGIWERVCIWHDGSNKNYPKETWDYFSEELDGGLSTAWRKVRMVKELNGKRKILKTKINKEIYETHGAG